jgi:hypothetical protein
VRYQTRALALRCLSHRSVLVWAFALSVDLDVLFDDVIHHPLLQVCDAYVCLVDVTRACAGTRRRALSPGQALPTARLRRARGHCAYGRDCVCACVTRCVVRSC